MYFGFHISIANGLEKALEKATELGCKSMQIFPGNPRSWLQGPFNREDVDIFLEKRTQSEIKYILIHTPYLVTLATPDKSMAAKSAYLLEESLKKAEQIGAEYVITHLGSGKESARQEALENVVKRLKKISQFIPSGVQLLLENTAGGGNIVGNNIQELAYFIEQSGSDKIGLALDTCHLYAAGYDVFTRKKQNNFLRELDDLIGINKLRALHLNDCLAGLGSRRDRHAGIGEGNIGLEGFQVFVNYQYFTGLPAIMETPRQSDLDDLQNMKTITSLVG